MITYRILRGIDKVDMRAEAASFVANAARLDDDWCEAQAVWSTVAGNLLKGSGDPILVAELAERRAALLTDQQRLEEARDLLSTSARTYRLLDDRDRLGRCCLKLSRCHRRRGELERSLEEAWHAVEVIDASREPRLMLLAMLYVAGTLGELGRAHDGYTLLRSAWPQFEAQDSPKLLQRARWTRGRLASELGKLRTAEKMLSGVRNEFLDSRQRLEAALVSLDLALVYARRDWPEPQRRLADETAPIFQALHLERETLAACLLYVDAAHRQAVTVTLVEDVLRRLEPMRRGGAVARRPIGEPEAGEPG